VKVKRLSRRTVLRGLGGMSLGLPLLEAMAPLRESHAQAATAPKRFLVYFTPGGTVREEWQPDGSETNFTFRQILSPLEAIRDRVLLVDGLDLKVTAEGHGHPHSRGMGGVLTGQPLNDGPYETCMGTAGFADGPSLDQVLAERLKVGRKLASLEVAVNWPTDRRDGGKAAPTNCINYSGRNQAVPMAIDPKAVWDRLFSDFTRDPNLGEAQTRHKLSILDAVAEEYRQLIPKLGKSDRLKLEEHLARVAELERSANATPAMPSGSCVPMPAPVPLGDASAGQIGEPGSNGQYNTILDAAMPAVGKTMMDLVAMAFACDLTAVATLQWSDSQSYNTFPWLDLNENHHAYQHDHGYQPEALTKVYNWYAKQFTYMVQALETAGVLSETVVLWVTEISHPNSHDQRNMPFVLAGGGAALRTGRYLRYPNLPHNDLLTALANLYGVETDKFGKAEYCNGALSGLT
jgi:hypothetical protein